MRPILVTGSGGFVGRYIVPRLRAAFPEIPLVPVVRRSPPVEGGVQIDLADHQAVEAMVAEVNPAVVVHLAAHSSVGSAKLAPNGVWRDNRDASFWLARALARHTPDATVLIASTAEVYGRNLKLGPATEDTAPAPIGTYANSKRAAEYVFETLLPPTAQLIIARPFNHTGVGQLETFVVPSFAAQIARIEAGLVPPRMFVGNLDAERDFLDVRDVADSYVEILKRADRLPQRSIFNIVRGETVSIRAILDRLCALAKADVTVEVDPQRLRPNEIPVATATIDKLCDLMPWPPERTFDETLLSVLEEQRHKVAAHKRNS